MQILPIVSNRVFSYNMSAKCGKITFAFAYSAVFFIPGISKKEYIERIRLIRQNNHLTKKDNYWNKLNGDHIIYYKGDDI